MKGRGRAQRVGVLVRQEVASMLTNGLKDPRLGFVSVIAVEMSPDLHYANVHVSLFGNDKERKSSLIALRNSAGWIRRNLGKNLRLRVTPEVRFFEDTSLDEVYHLEEVLKKIRPAEPSAPDDAAADSADNNPDDPTEYSDGSH